MSRRIATLWDSRGNEESDHEHDDHNHGQAFYAGGSEHSGQQILGPNRDDANPASSSRLVENLFTHATRQASALADDPSSSPGLGQNSESTLPIRFWRNGFTIGEEEQVHDYAAPENRQFLEYLRRGETPPELANRVRSGIVDVKLENNVHSDYKPKTTTRAFSGEGKRLGAPTPEVVKDNADQQETDFNSSGATGGSSLKVDESKPVTNVQVRLLDNTRLLVRINLTNTIADLTSHIRSVRPQYSETNFALATTFPAKELSDSTQTIEEAKLANASVLQKIKR